jgi:hypothetical protein
MSPDRFPPLQESRETENGPDPFLPSRFAINSSDPFLTFTCSPRGKAEMKNEKREMKNEE